MVKQTRVNKQPTVINSSVMYQGPLPTPEAFAGYNSVLPGAAERILSMAESDPQLQKTSILEEQNRKNQIVQNSHTENMAQIRTGQIFVYILLFFSGILLLSGLFMIVFKNDWMGCLLAGPSFIASCVQAIRYIFPSKYSRQ